MKLFIDTEFTGLQKTTDLISLGIISDTGHTFYAEFKDYDKSKINIWLETNVIDNLSLYHINNELLPKTPEKWESVGGISRIHAELEDWLSQFDGQDIQIWSDCLAYDWVLFCDIFNGPMNLPDNVSYIPMDICTLFEMRGIDPDISREEYAGIEGAKHNALHDALVIKACYDKLMNKEEILETYTILIDAWLNADGEKTVTELSESLLRNHSHNQ